VSCGFYLPLAGAMRQSFGVCANVYAPDDGRAVSADHGCGAHSEVLIEATVEVDEAPTIYDDGEVDPVDVTPDALAAAVEAKEIIDEPLPEAEVARVPEDAPETPETPETPDVPDAPETAAEKQEAEEIAEAVEIAAAETENEVERADEDPGEVEAPHQY